ncbi:PLDc N-terminal domain-containing protein [Microbacterium sp. zg.Y625]|uniref:PLDc N-terminal domain-containing protein n=1 Tax=Microbacterium jiangjiandongii TaxID=3049071 RepID=UPI00214C1BE2|nr:MULTISPECIES: PLDc N-terminal domain-containing protein [unclassified Microbacterium]MCR2791452.1 PLDc N-terminal domain-containing protein [Microbacterium sp. zg.Y625]WIM24288.1 PLDc N-terminal domain-containing protein [Microbacterium sp. zg-Y625]
MTNKTDVQLPDRAKEALGIAKEAVKVATVARGLGKLALVLLGLVQVAFAFLAFWDLAWRDGDDVRGPKPVWVPVILINWVGPAAYFLAGIRHKR